MLNAKSSATPFNSSIVADSSRPFEDPVLYRITVGALQYVTITRPDIAFAVNKACQKMQLPSIADRSVVKRILRYLVGTISYGLQFTLMLIGQEISLTGGPMVAYKFFLVQI
ncbi:uncharacterized protein LOC113305581 [Papaver somniferum]|uniref:uncharacterized protein LOC113305581 n=1 Tax=Papaver somniferum TaxID=3469 RepID=UPI000E6F704C|nr:uncharacterized protein LOC113305581 [Papaver somniferum]